MYIKLGYIKYIEDEYHVEVTRDFSLIEYEDYKNYNSVIGLHLSNVNLFKLICKNGLQFEEFLYFLNEQDNNEGSGNLDAETVLFEVNRLLMNYLSMLKTFDDHLSSILSKKYGTGTLDMFKNHLSRLYDDYFIYRFLIRLRNYAQHQSIPVTIYKKSIEGHQFYIDRDALLKYTGWSSVKKELLDLDSQIEISNMISEMSLIMKSAYLKVMSFYVNDIISAHQWFETLFKELDYQNPVFVISENLNEYKNHKFSLIPIDGTFFIRALEDLNELSVTNKAT